MVSFFTNILFNWVLNKLKKEHNEEIYFMESSKKFISLIDSLVFRMSMLLVNFEKTIILVLT